MNNIVPFPVKNETIIYYISPIVKAHLQVEFDKGIKKSFSRGRIEGLIYGIAICSLFNLALNYLVK